MRRYATRRWFGVLVCGGALALAGCSDTADVATGVGSPAVSASAAPSSSSTSAAPTTLATTTSAPAPVTAASLPTTTSTPETTTTTTEPETTTTTEPEPETTTTAEPLPEVTTTTEPATTTTAEPQPRVIELQPRVGGELDPYVGIITGRTAGGEGGFNVYAQCRPGPLTVTIHEVGDALVGHLNIMISADDSTLLQLGPATKGMVITGQTNTRVRLHTTTITAGYRIEYRCVGR